MNKHKFTKFCAFSRPRHFQCGAAVVELAIVIVLMTLLAAGIFEFSRAFWYYNALDKGTRDAARYLSALPTSIVNNSSSLSTAVAAAKQRVVDTASSANLNPALGTGDVSVTWDCGACAGGKPDYVTVAVSYSVTIGATLPFIGVTNTSYGPVTLTPHTTMQYMN